MLDPVLDVTTLVSEYAAGFTQEYRDALAYLDEPTPCGEGRNQDKWAEPRNQRSFDYASERCHLHCEIRDACERQGRAARETGIWGGLYLRHGVPVPFKDRTLYSTQTAAFEHVDNERVLEELSA